ncbi:MAG: hypothetical protein ACRD2C_16310 [Acidimicrobiales bacterium]
MRKPNEEDLSGEAADASSVGDGFGGAVDFSDSGYYGSSFDDDYTSDEDESLGDDESDESFEDDASDGGLDTDETAFGDEVTEDQAEDILEDMLDEAYGPDAAAMVDNLEESSGMSAVEILEDITGMDLGGDREADDFESPDGSSDGGVGAIDPFESPDMPEADMATPDDFDLNRDDHVDVGDAHEAAHVLDFDVSE